MPSFDPFCYENPEMCGGVVNNVPYSSPPYNPNQQQQGGVPNWVINQGGATAQQGTYSQTLQAILSGIALFQHQPYVPTTVQPVQQPQVIYQPQGGYGYGNEPARSNAFGGIQQYIQEHPLPVLGGVILLAALLMKPPVRRA